MQAINYLEKNIYYYVRKWSRVNHRSEMEEKLEELGSDHSEIVGLIAFLSCSWELQ